MYGHFSRFTAEFQQKFLKNKIIDSSLSPTKQYRQYFEFLKNLKLKNEHDLIEQHYLLMKLAYILYDIKYFQQFKKKLKSQNVMNVGEKIWYSLFLYYSGKKEDFIELYKDLRHNIIPRIQGYGRY